MPSPSTELSGAGKAQLAALARASIGHGLTRGEPLAVLVSDYPAELRARRATFVTLTAAGKLRGCIGSIEARRALVEDVVENAFAAAFGDYRFPALTQQEFPKLAIEISLLSEMQGLAVASQAELKAQLRPGIDGLLIEQGARRATFLPQVWASLPDADEFIRQLKRKGGLVESGWSPDIQCWRYQVDKIEQHK